MLSAVTPACERGRQVRIGQGGQQPDDNLPGAERSEVARIRLADHEHDVSGQGVGTADDARSRLRIAVIGMPGAIASTGLDEHLQAGRAQLNHGLGHERDAPLTRRGLLDHGYLHGQTSLGRRAHKAARRQAALLSMDRTGK